MTMYITQRGEYVKNTASSTVAFISAIGEYLRYTATGGTTANPTVGINNIVGTTPSIGLEKSFGASVGNVLNQGQVATVTLGGSIYNASALVGNVQNQGQTPTISYHKTAFSSVGINNIVGQVPTTSYGNSYNASALVGVNNIVGGTPTVGQQKTFSPSVGNVQNVGGSPTITWQLTILAATGTNHIIGGVPSVTFGAVPVFSASPQAGVVSNYGQIPQIQRGIWTPMQTVTSFWTPDTPVSTIWS